MKKNNLITPELKKLLKDIMTDDFDKNESLFLDVSIILGIPVSKIRALAMEE